MITVAAIRVNLAAKFDHSPGERSNCCENAGGRHLIWCVWSVMITDQHQHIADSPKVRVATALCL